MTLNLARRLTTVAFAATVCVFTSPSARAQNGALFTAAKNGDLATVTALLNSGADVNDSKFAILASRGDSTALMEASFYGHIEVVRALLAAKANVNATVSDKKDGETALTLAVQKGHVEIVRMLLAAGANVDQPCCGANAVYDAARTGNMEMLKVLLAAKPDVNRGERINGRTPLMVTFGGRHWDMARMLVEAGADVNRADNHGFTPLLSIARDPENLAMVQFLLANHANPNYRDCIKSFMTPLGFASANGNVETVRALLAAKADPRLKQCDEKTPLELALQNDHPDVAEMLRSAISH